MFCYQTFQHIALDAHGGVGTRPTIWVVALEKYFHLHHKQPRTVAQPCHSKGYKGQSAPEPKPVPASPYRSRNPKKYSQKDIKV